MEISVVIPSYNTQDYIEKTLNNLVIQIVDVDYEIIVVDCSEHDEVGRIVNRIRDSFSNLRFIHIKEHFYPGKGRNIGASKAHGELIVFMDADVILTPESLGSAWRHFQGGKEIFGGALELNSNVSNGLAAYVEHYFFNHESQKGRPECKRKNLSSALMFFDIKIFLKEGGFTDIPRMQDTELTERLRKKGFDLYFCPDILAYQIQDSPLSKVFKKIYINGQNIYYIRYQSSMSFSKKIVFIILLPLATVTKIGRIIFRHLIFQSGKGKLIVMAISIPLLISSLFWMAGFYHALLTEKGMERDR